MISLAIDAGNSKVKIAVIQDDNILEIKSAKNLSLNMVTRLMDAYHPEGVILSSVRIFSDDKIQELRKLFAGKLFLNFDSSTPLPIKNNYLTPETLGLDRIATAVYAAFTYPKKNCLIIDAGTCITLDFLDGKNGFMGGSILPGIQMRFKALHNYTDKLPLLKKSVPGPLTGTNTKTSILSGVLHASLFEIEGFIAFYRKNYSDLKVLLTGGDTDFFETQLKSKIFAHPNMVLLGLHKILKYNAES